jgi:SpoVK/Ycf46/Vps4 family AAA+-type ATPase
VRTVIDASFGTPTIERTIINTSAPTTDVPKDEVGIDDDDEFARLLDKFLNEGMEIVDEKAPFDNTNGDQQDDEGDVDLDDLPEDSVHTDDESIADIPFPDGEIEQNQNISVKVEILRPIANPRDELNKLVGCSDIKRRMDELVALTSYNKMMHELFPNGKQHEVSLHSVFLGRPGTGKTTVCKIFGSLLRQAGALSKGHVVVCDRGTFIGTLWGDEERSMKQVLEMAKGGVLMVDEAYLLNGKHENDPGKLVIQLLMNILADETQRDIAVVLCGYKEPMQKLLDSNPGLQSRFPNKFEFTDFSIEELLEITRRRVREYEYEFTPEAWDKYRDVLAEAYQQRDPQTWGNARFIGNLLDRIYIQHAKRCVRERPTEKGQLRLLTPDDICQIEVPKPRPSIGFAISR